MANPERYQMPFDFAAGADRSHIYYELGFTGPPSQEDNSGRFVRQLREEVIVRSPAEAATHLCNQVFVPFEQFDQEELWGLLLNTKHRVTHEALIYRGTVNAITIRPAELFKEAVRINAPALILSHIHPSGDPSPSPEDLHVTEEGVAAGRLLGIELLDHIIVGRDGRWVSLKERGAGFGR